MKKFNLIATAIVAGTLSASALAYDGQVKFVGKITDETCTVTNNPSNPLTVTLGEVAQSAFTGVGVSASTTKFTLALTACPAAAKKAKVKFDGTPHATNADFLALTSEAGVATGVGVEILDANAATIPMNTSSMEYPLVAGANNLDFKARYTSTAATVTTGPANASTNFTINYN